MAGDIVGSGASGVYVALAFANGQFADTVLRSDSFGSTTQAGGWRNNNTYHSELADVNDDGLADMLWCH